MTLITLYSIQNIKHYDGGDNLNVKYFFELSFDYIQKNVVDTHIIQ